MKQIYLLTICLVIFSFIANAQTWEWTKPEPNGTIGGVDESDNVYRVVTDNAGNVYQLGSFADSLYLNNTFITAGKGCYITKYTASGSLLWYKTIISTGTVYTGEIRTTDITVNNTGIYIAGYYSPTQVDYYYCTSTRVFSYSIGSYAFTSQPGDGGMFFAKLDFDGTVQWNKTINALRNSGGHCNTEGSCGLPVYLSSDKNDNVIVSFTWSSGIDGNFTLGGQNFSVSVFHNNLVIIKYNSEGVTNWYNFAVQNSKPGFSLPKTIRAKSLTTDNLGNIFLDCDLSDSTSFGSIIFHTASNNNQANTLPWSSCVLVKINSAGVWSFAKEVSNITSDLSDLNIQNIATDNANNVYVLANVNSLVAGVRGIIAGDTLASTYPFSYVENFLVKYDNNGNFLWYKFFGGKAGGFANGINYANDQLYISGSMYPDNSKSFQFSSLTVPGTSSCSTCSAGGLLYFVSKADTSGKFIWAETVTASRALVGMSVTAFNDNIYTSGNYVGSVKGLGNLNGLFTNPDWYVQNSFTGKLKDQYIRVGALSNTQVMPGCSFNIPFTSTGLILSSKNRFTAELSNSSGDFTVPTIIGSVKSTGSGSINATVPAALAVGTSGYRIRIRSSDTLLTGFNYFAYADTGYTLSVACPGIATGLTTTNITGTSATLNWNSVGCATGYKIQYRIKNTTVWTTIQTPASSINIGLTGLSLNTIYQWRIATKCTNNSVNSFSAYSAIKQFTTLASFAANENISDAQSASTYGINISPNPAKDQLNIAVNNLKTIVQSVQVLNASGSKMAEQSFGASSKLTINVSGYSTGMYMLLIKTNEGFITKKFIKE